jgi:hypothetical protein
VIATGVPKMPNGSGMRFAQFFHRRNKDASFDSICGLCFLTVALAEAEPELHLRELAHQCEKRQIHLVKPRPKAR